MAISFPKFVKKIDFLLVLVLLVLVLLNFTPQGNALQDMLLARYHTLYYGILIPFIFAGAGAWVIVRFKSFFGMAGKNLMRLFK